MLVEYVKMYCALVYLSKWFLQRQATARQCSPRPFTNQGIIRYTKISHNQLWKEIWEVCGRGRHPHNTTQKRTIFLGLNGSVTCTGLLYGQCRLKYSDVAEFTDVLGERLHPVDFLLYMRRKWLNSNSPLWDIGDNACIITLYLPCQEIVGFHKTIPIPSSAFYREN